MGRKLDVNSGWSVNLVTALIGFYVIEPRPMKIWGMIRSLSALYPKQTHLIVHLVVHLVRKLVNMINKNPQFCDYTNTEKKQTVIEDIRGTKLRRFHYISAFFSNVDDLISKIMITYIVT